MAAKVNISKIILETLMLHLIYNFVTLGGHLKPLKFSDDTALLSLLPEQSPEQDQSVLLQVL